jgi:guanosine-3',5'-bis(diphosphate) 3'-pyrophosphohydrolase
VSTELILKAVDFAARKHRDQRRKDPDASPYINHPIAVARVIAEIGGVTDPAALAGALLHDTLEDTETTPEELETQFGAEIRAIVEAVTDDKSLPKQERKALQIQHAAALSNAAALVKLGDKISNVTDIVESPPQGWSRERRVEYIEWAWEVVRNCPPVNAALKSHFEALAARALERV